MLKWLHRVVVALLVFMTVATILLMIYHYKTNETLQLRIIDCNGPDVGGRYHVRVLFLENMIGVLDVYRNAEFVTEQPRRGKKTLLYAWGTVTTMRHEFYWPDAPRDFNRISHYGLSTWFVSILTAIYPTVFFVRTFRRRRLNRQALRPCGQCGYDLQGNESGTCPEYGTAIVLPGKTEVAG